jgi:rhamnosyltransferase
MMKIAGMHTELATTQNSDSYQSDSFDRVVAVIVTFHPDIKKLNKILFSVTEQVESVIIVNNGDYLGLQESLANVKIHHLNANLGIAAAQNFGINHALNLGAKFVLLLDQDSVPANNMVEKLMEAYNEASQNHVVAAVGPSYHAERSDFVVLKGFSLKRAPCESSKIVPVDHLIASGSLIELNAVKSVGLMNESFFIDLVDTEWCLRARVAGYKLIGACSARMDHSLGEYSTNILGRSVPVHKSFRYYYIIRNSILLMLSSYTPLQWKVTLLFRAIKIAIFFSLFTPTRLDNLKMMIKGTKDALGGVKGKLP